MDATGTIRGQRILETEFHGHCEELGKAIAIYSVKGGQSVEWNVEIAGMAWVVAFILCAVNRNTKGVAVSIGRDVDLEGSQMIETTAKAARGGRPWTSDAQRVWLMDRMESYMEARQSKQRGSIAGFRRKVLDDFIQEFWKNKKMSVEERGEALGTLDRRIREWFVNHSRKAGPIRGSKVLDLRGTKKKRLAAWQAYSRLYYDTVLKPLVEEQWREDPAYDPTIREVPFKFRNRAVCNLWRIEQDERVKEEVAAYIKEEYQRGGNMEEEDDLDGDDDGDVDPAELSRRQANRKLQTYMCKQIYRELGFVGVVCFTGPEPKSGGSIVATFGTDGQTEAGRALTDVYPELKAQLEGLVYDFASQVTHLAKHQAALRRLLEKSKYRFDSKANDAMYLDDDDSGTVGQDTDMENGEGGGSDGGAKPNDEDGGDTPGNQDGEDDADMLGGKDDEENNNDTDAPEDNNGDGNDREGSIPEVHDDVQGGEKVLKDDEVRELAKNDELKRVIALEPLPGWLRKAVSYLRAYKGHAGYLGAIAELVNFERHVKRNPGKPLPATSRPSILSMYIRGGRDPEKHTKLTVDELDQLHNELFSWWFVLQPKSRIPPNFDESLQDCSLLLRISTTSHQDWPDLYRGSTNGVYGVFICLGWWLEADCTPGTKYDNLIDDICWVLKTMVTVPAPGLGEKPPSRRR
ncbi:hypothetical protein PLEOSDRAFT_1085350 [Pleurotus ostreatus PC15]|uniref:Uncharacterized protein n=1 Tax=Pleurotus ostreatus (strain PC15) TaxID=1137138 RepID=A0A067NGF9_PLEO1|nr:hypothetical protein PLEOSDRAFT_1085350 [Pleurotus ostreatus PC15]